jgi:hypothetical protein
MEILVSRNGGQPHLYQPVNGLDGTGCQRQRDNLIDALGRLLLSSRPDVP